MSLGTVLRGRADPVRVPARQNTAVYTSLLPAAHDAASGRAFGRRSRAGALLRRGCAGMTAALLPRVCGASRASGHAPIPPRMDVGATRLPCIRQPTRGSPRPRVRCCSARGLRAGRPGSALPAQARACGSRGCARSSETRRGGSAGCCPATCPAGSGQTGRTRRCRRTPPRCSARRPRVTAPGQPPARTARRAMPWARRSTALSPYNALSPTWTPSCGIHWHSLTPRNGRLRQVGGRDARARRCGAGRTASEPLTQQKPEPGLTARL
jgi:hypothetical protein